MSNDDPVLEVEQEEESPGYDDPKTQSRLVHAAIAPPPEGIRAFIAWILGYKRKIDSADGLRSETRLRRLVGAVLGGVGIGVVYLIVTAAFNAINESVKIPKDAGSAELWLRLVAVVGHAAISLGAVWFAYQLLRAAERMFVPRRLLQNVKEVELVRALIGIDAPTSAAADQVKALLGDAALMKSLVELIKAARGK